MPEGCRHQGKMCPEVALTYFELFVIIIIII
jgi:hypothetical protein